MYGETNQANYLINAKGSNSKSHNKVLFNDRTNNGGVVSTFDQQPVSPFKDQSHKVEGMRETPNRYSYTRTRY